MNEEKKLIQTFHTLSTLMKLKNDVNAHCKQLDDHIAIVALMQLLCEISNRQGLSKEDLYKGLDESYDNAKK